MKALFEGRPNAVFLDLSGFDVASQGYLRQRLNELAGGGFVVAKKTLLQRAWQDAFEENTQKSLQEVLDMSAPLAIAISTDSPEKLPKLLLDISKEVHGKKEGERRLLGGLLGEEYLSAGQVKDLADLPEPELLQANLLGVLQNSIGQALNVLQAPSRDLLSILSQKSQASS